MADATERQLYVFDSFEGLLEVDEYNLTDFHARRGASWTTPWTSGRYDARKDLVEANVAKFGQINRCKFIQGWFEKTLTPANLPEIVALPFVDVDIPQSARQCFEPIWPRVPEHGVFATHDVAYLKVLKEIVKATSEMATARMPLIIGAGFGLGDAAPHLGFLVKGDLDPAYIKSLLIEKP